MAVPKKKISKQRRDTRRAHDAISPINISFNSKTGAPQLSHHMSKDDGIYKGRQVLIAKTKTDDKAEDSSE